MLDMTEQGFDKMNPEVKTLWVQALRSGEYQQGRGRLNSTDILTQTTGYCCLGVLCDVYNKNTGKGEWLLDGRGTYGKVFVAAPNDRSATTLPNAVTEWSGLNQYSAVSHLVEMNDSRTIHRDFNGIADWIEENL